MDTYYIGIDNGGTSCKAVLFDSKGNEVCHASRLLPLSTPKPGFTERNMEELWDMNVACLREVVESSGIDPKAIHALACSGHGKGLYLIDEAGNPVRDGIVSTDTRARMYPEKWNADGTSEEIFKTNYQSILACQPVSLLRWIQEEEPENFQKIRWIFEVKDFIRYKLTGEIFAEITDYSGSNLLDLSKRAFSFELLKRFGLEDVFDCLPPLKKSTDICGYITKEVSELTLLPEGTPVAGGMFDIDACSIAMNIVDSDYLCVIAGTWSINEYISKNPVLNHSVMMNSCYCIDDYFLIEESSPTSAGNLEWYIRMFMQKEKAECKEKGTSIYKYCDDLVLSVQPEDQDIVFLPYIYGSNYNPSAKACFIGLDSHHTQAHIIRSVFEGIVFCHMVHLEKLLACKQDFKAIRLAGGAANSLVWTQMFADITGLPVEIVEVPELGALGVAMASAVACGDYATIQDASAAMSKIGKKVIPSPNRAKYLEKFKKYKALSESLDAYWA